MQDKQAGLWIRRLNDIGRGAIEMIVLRIGKILLVDSVFSIRRFVD
jgi:hypothetical protein